ncbi:CBS domain containing protein [Photobacterium iliopiscarium]|uniref:CBS domain-containing protein n=1 Tax=Photobacterium iliopiscarium TaxID=56192 RepID=A0A0D8P0N4_9GAMM|nr:CBS domain-containing protein [Photobacterium iliopiscarium]KJG12358.1 CBS domain containing protein [Photobacterium iliopiscarium]KJG23256.1 CBS domain containing protein [Photobacterium iliopiscarium]MCD9467066.1 CBS domain-containing protein [Photobacterium iliopiscarium]MCD9486997.1 CBS domain-containing protein [Photobacterium iliopiscarium]MCF2243576.1 CBS domain-containing protein [Photobacterium iliopiscarium]
MESLKIKDYMNIRPVTFTENMSLSAALDKLLTAKQIGGPVINEHKQVVGFISEQDMIHKLLKVGYHCQDSHTVSECMRVDVLTVSGDDTIIVLAETMTGQKPKIYPVVDDGRLVGVITRRDVLTAISNQIGACFKHPL